MAKQSNSVHVEIESKGRDTTKFRVNGVNMLDAAVTKYILTQSACEKPVLTIELLPDSVDIIADDVTLVVESDNDA